MFQALYVINSLNEIHLESAVISIQQIAGTQNNSK